MRQGEKGCSSIANVPSLIGHVVRRGWDIFLLILRAWSFYSSDRDKGFCGRGFPGLRPRADKTTNAG